MKTEYCADVIAMFQNRLVLVERLKFPEGYALPGGRRDQIGGKLETVRDCAIREFCEETGLTLVIEGGLGTYDAPGRDPRGPKISTVVYGRAEGTMRDEIGKTRVFLMDLCDVSKNEYKFVFDHYQIIGDWLRIRK